MKRCPVCDHVYISVSELVERMKEDTGTEVYAMPIDVADVRRKVDEYEKANKPRLFA